jgi:transcriptional regulator with XRE-family HTH domain
MPTLSLRQWRNKKAVSLKDLEASSGVAISTLSRIETGKHKARHVTKRKVAAALGLIPEDIDFK